ncbi:ubiquitin-like-conjugating enzyme ATG3 [Zophobas morio]|jgi:ubiquitin-like-conjugating enzyme ATG3|uniref:ubiquitin-like-conjugating enzyme ATG3 n=1 Tax=Zophobas morio TaxID=2755281 RepID=UPI003082E012
MSPRLSVWLHNIGETLTPVLSNSKFQETGIITPKEFEIAGDYLTYMCPTWKWCTCEKGKLKTYLSKDKQFLQTKNVPCHKRVSEIDLLGEEKVVVESDGEEWVDTQILSEFHSTVEGATDDIQVIEGKTTNAGDISDTLGQLAIQEVAESDSDCDIEDLEAAASDFKEVFAVAPKPQGDNENVVKTRTYDITITYDKYYQTPRVWLTGYNELGEPLTRQEMFEDFSQDHAKKTVTYETHPQLPCNMMSIHPCRHGKVMKRLLQNYKGSTPVNVHLYLIIFLKFVQSVIPTIEYDFTKEFDCGGGER